MGMEKEMKVISSVSPKADRKGGGGGGGGGGTFPELCKTVALVLCNRSLLMMSLVASSTNIRS